MQLRAGDTAQAVGHLLHSAQEALAPSPAPRTPPPPPPPRQSLDDQKCKVIIDGMVHRMPCVNLLHKRKLEREEEEKTNSGMKKKKKQRGSRASHTQEITTESGSVLCLCPWTVWGLCSQTHRMPWIALGPVSPQPAASPFPKSGAPLHLLLPSISIPGQVTDGQVSGSASTLASSEMLSTSSWTELLLFI